MSYANHGYGRGLVGFVKDGLVVTGFMGLWLGVPFSILPLNLAPQSCPSVFRSSGCSALRDAALRGAALRIAALRVSTHWGS